MSPNAFALQALSYITPASSEPNVSTATTAQKTRIATDLTATMKEIVILKPDFFKRPISALLRAPETVTISVTQASTAVASLTLGSATFEQGCTIQIAGEPNYNELRMEGAAYILRLPFTQATGSYIATIYHDSVPLPGAAREVAGPVIIPDDVILSKRQNRDDALRSPLPVDDYGRRARVFITRRMSGKPGFYWIESFYQTDVVLSYRLRVLPMPSTSVVLEFIANIQPPRYAAADLTSSTDIPAPDDAAEAIVLPMFLRRWMGSPWMRDVEGKTEIKEQDKTARLLLNEIKIQRRASTRIVAPI